MAILRLSNGGDLHVTGSVEETLAALGGRTDFVPLQSDDGVVQVRPSGVIAVLDSDDRKGGGAGFRMPSAEGVSPSD